MMSIEKCHRCEDIVDTDEDPAAYMLNNEFGKNVAVCKKCRMGNYADLIKDFPIREKMFEFLEELRESGIVNMFGSFPYLAEEFDIENEDAKDIFMEWILTGRKDERKH